MIYRLRFLENWVLINTGGVKDIPKRCYCLKIKDIGNEMVSKNAEARI